jgi:hypothetical protein
MPVWNVFDVARNYRATPDFPDYEAGKILALFKLNVVFLARVC